MKGIFGILLLAKIILNEEIEMILIGSNALKLVCENKGITFPRNCVDFDYLCTEENWKEDTSKHPENMVERSGNKGHILYCGSHYEHDIAQEGDSTDLLMKWCHEMVS